MPKQSRRQPKKKNSVSVNCKDLYQFLIESCRYGYTRNNHLMPSGAFDHCYHYLPLLKNADGEWAEHIALQLAEEAISELKMDSLSDEKKKFSIFKEDPSGATEEIKAVWTKGLYRFSITYHFIVEPGIKFISEDNDVEIEFLPSEEEGKVNIQFADFSKKKNHNIFMTLLRENPFKPGWYDSILKLAGMTANIGEELLLTVDRGGAFSTGLNVKEYVKFIDFCLDFVDKTRTKVPYNYNDYLQFLIEHPKS